MSDTNCNSIAAISTPAGIGGIAIIRISGPSSLSVLERLFLSKAFQKEKKDRYLYYGKIINRTGDILDEALAVYLKAPRTYTREDMVEIHCHGGFACVKAVLEAVLEQEVRPAEPGEFTKRAFLNGRLDLVQAESVMDLINSASDMSREAALTQLSGKLSLRIQSMRNELLTLMAHIEASIDYPEHEMETWNREIILSKGNELRHQMEDLLKTWDRGRMVKEGIETVILGRPNVGKSSLLNLFSGSQRAIVTDIPGTTRDLLQEYINLDGITLKLVDTAGIRSTEDTIEKMGVERSRQAAATADLLLIMLDASEPLRPEDREILTLAKDRKAIIILNKADLPTALSHDDVQEEIPTRPQVNILSLSVLKEQGMEGLYSLIKDMFFQGDIRLNDQLCIQNIRQKQALSEAAESINMALDTIEAGLPEDLAAIDLRQCYEALGRITGEALEDDLIDKIFSEFCLGK